MSVDDKVDVVMAMLAADPDVPPMAVPIIRVVLADLFSLADSLRRVADRLDAVVSTKGD